jgi:hypothetical protein
MATSSSGLLGRLPDLIAHAKKTEEGRPFGKILPPLVDAGDHPASLECINKSGVLIVQDEPLHWI